MRYIFFGTPEFAAIILEMLIKAGMPPVALVCNPDKPVGRKKIITPPQTKLVVSGYPLITVLQPDKLDGTFLNILREVNADFYVVAAYAKILKKGLLGIPKLGVIGVHPSLLPKYRGSSPIQTAILNRDEETGVDLFMIDEGVDHGPVIAARSLRLATGADYKSTEKELAKMGAELLIEMLPKFAAGKIKPAAQDESKATYTKKFETKDGFTAYADLERAQDGDLNLAREIDAKIRALSQEPGVYTIKNDKRIKLLRSRVEDNSLKIIQIHVEGKTPAEIKSRL